jgi:hypothetical protein
MIQKTYNAIDFFNDNNNNYNNNNINNNNELNFLQN